MEKIIMHIDVNSAFLSWTAVDLLNKRYKKDIRNYPSVVGGDPKTRTGIVLAASSIAKKIYNIKTGETLYSAKRKCKSLEIYPSNYELYSEMSYKFINIIKNYTPDYEQVSIDECFIDYTSVKFLYGDVFGFAKKIQLEIYNKLGFTVNIGIANNKLCAKMASDFSKPNKIHTLYNYEVKIKMWSLSVGELYGIGKKTTEVLVKLGIKTIEDLAKCDINYLYKYFKNQAKFMIDSANGIDESIVDSSEYVPKGIGNELTIDHDVTDIEELSNYLLTLSETVGLRIRKISKYASVIVVTLKDNKFKRYNHQRKIKNPTDSSDEIYKISKEILKEMNMINPIRLIGIRLDSLIDNNSCQLSLFESNINKTTENKKLDKTVDELKNKYGLEIVKKASLVNENIRKPHKNS